MMKRIAKSFGMEILREVDGKGDANTANTFKPDGFEAVLESILSKSRFHKLLITE